MPLPSGPLPSALPGAPDRDDADGIAAARRWLEAHGADAAVAPHHDADGLSAGVLLARRAGGPVLHVESPWTDPVAAPNAAVVADWGVRSLPNATAEVLYVDHHADPEPVEATVAHAVGEGISTSVLAWEILGCPDDGAWLAALGAVGDMAEAALERPELARAAGSRTSLKRLASLVTAPGRLRDGPVEVAYELLADSADARSALSDPRAATLAGAKETAGAARERAVRTAPRVGSDAVLIRFREPARVHPLVATAWARRLAPRVVVAANDGWRDGRVSFAVRSADGRDLRAWLRQVYEPPAEAGDYARGHARATGGALVPEAFEAFAEAILA